MITPLYLTSTVTNTAAPFTVGHPFKKGQIPAGSTVVADITDFQCVGQTFWEDGSLKFALLSGVTSLTANVQKTITLSLGTAPGGTALTIADLKATLVTADVTMTDAKDWTFDTASETVGTRLKMSNLLDVFEPASSTITVDNGATIGAVTATQDAGALTVVLTAPLSGGTVNGYQTVKYRAKYRPKRNITAITKGTVTRVTVSGGWKTSESASTDGLGARLATVGNTFTFADVGGMTELNGLTGTVTAVDNNSSYAWIEVNIDSTNFTTFTSGGTATKNELNTSDFDDIAYVRTGGGLAWDGTKCLYSPTNSTGQTGATWATTDWDTPFEQLVSGPKMSSWRYRKALTPDPHMSAWLEVRLYTGGAVQILPFVENGVLKELYPGARQATFAFSVNGVVKFNRSVELKAHTRTVLIDGTHLSYWNVTDPDVVPQHDRDYVYGTRLIPTYIHVTPDSASTLSGEAYTAFVPFQKGNHQTAMGSGGFQPDIGIIANHDALYFTNGSRKSYEGMVRNNFSTGRYRIHYREEVNGRHRPLRFSDYPNLVLKSTGAGMSSIGISGSGDYTPTEVGGTLTGPSAYFSSSHHPSMGYVAHMVTGWHYFREEMQFLTTLLYLKNSTDERMRDKYILRPDAGANQTRGAAWALRSLVQAAALTPETDPLAVELRASVENNIQYVHAKYIAQPNCPFGFMHLYTDYGGSEGHVRGSGFQQDFMTMSFGHMKNLDPLLSADARTKLAAFFVWKAQAAIGRLGGTGPDEFLYRNAQDYEVPLGTKPLTATDFETGTGPWLANWGASWDLLYPTGIRADGPLQGALGAGSYFANLLPAIAAAVEHGVSGARPAYDRLVTASNWPTQEAAFVNYPVYGIKPANLDLPAPTGEKIRVDVVDLIPGRCLVGFRGLGIPAQNIPSAGTDGPGLGYEGLSFPADTDKEVRIEMVDLPVGDLVIDDNYGATYQGASSTSSFKIYEDGVLKGTATQTYNMGVSTIPDAPTGLIAEVDGASVVVHFTTPASNGGSPITLYTATSSGGQQSTATASPITIAIPLDTPMTFTVFATNKNGDGPPSAPSNSVTVTTVANVPSFPRSVVATPGDGFVSVSFVPPSSDGGSPITNYIATTSTGLSASGLTSPISITAPNDVSLNVTVVAVNAVGPGIASSPSNTVTPVAPPSDGSDMTTYYFDFSLAVNGDGSLADPFNTLVGLPVGPSNVYKLKRGTSWAGMFPPISAGTAENYTTFCAYYNADGTDDTTQPLPFLNLGDSALPSDVDYVCFENLSIKNTRLTAGNDVALLTGGNYTKVLNCFLDTNLTGLFFFNRSGVKISGNTIRSATMDTTANSVMGVVMTGSLAMNDNVVEDNFLLTGEAGNSASHVLRVEGYNGGAHSGLRIERNYIRTISGVMTTVPTKIGIYANNCDDAVIADNDVAYLLTGIFCNAADRVLIARNRTNYNGNFGIHVTTDTSYFIIERNECSYNGSATGMNYWGRGIELSGAAVQNSCTQHIVRHNMCAYNVNYGGPEDNGTEGVGIGLDDAASFCQVHNNTLYLNDGNGVQLYGGGTAPSETGGNVVSNNVFYNNGLKSFWGRRTGGLYLTPGAAQLTMSGTHGATTLAAHNTFVGGVGALREDANCSNVQKFDNIFVGQTKYAIAGALAYGTNNNLFHSDIPIQIGNLALDANNSPAPILLSTGSPTDRTEDFS